MYCLVHSLTPRAKPGCPEVSRPLVEGHMATMPAYWRVRPRTGETFESLEAFKDGVVGWLFWLTISGEVMRELIPISAAIKIRHV
jgi:hypothetical protein